MHSNIRNVDGFDDWRELIPVFFRVCLCNLLMYACKFATTISSQCGDCGHSYQYHLVSAEIPVACQGIALLSHQM